MAVTLNRLTANFVKSAPDGLHNDGAGLCLQVKGPARSWVYRFKEAGKIRTMGLGSATTVTLQAARKLAAECRSKREAGLDPLVQKRLSKAKAKAEEAAALSALLKPAAITFGEIADEVVSQKKADLKNLKNAMQWSVSLGTTPYDRDRLKAPAKAVDEHISALKALRALPVADVSTRDVEAVLRPIWSIVPGTAEEVRTRIAAVLDAAIVRGDRTAANMARYKGHLSHVLPRPKNGDAHFAAMPYEEAPAFFRALLADKPTMSAYALAFVMLTACRSGELRGMTWGEVDLDAKVWSISGDRTKTGKPHRVPLSSQAIEIMSRVMPFRKAPDKIVFIGARGAALSDMALTSLLRRLKAGYTAHGMRATFRTWAAEHGYPHDLAELALSHAIKSAVEKAYQRSDMLERRRPMMKAWADYLSGPEG